MNDFSLRFRFAILIAVVAISGFSQGMLMPVIAILFEQADVSSSINGLHSAGMYIGILLAAPFMEGALRKLGYRSLILFGGVIFIVCLAFFPIWQSLWFWFILRFLIGVGNSMLQIGSQTWITAFSSPSKRGRNIALYGLFFGLGFGVGPMMIRLVAINEALPFIISSGLSAIVCLGLLCLKNEFPEKNTEKHSLIGTFKRFGTVWKYAWVAFLLPFGFGFLESSLNGNFPVYALRVGLDINALSIILPSFAIGSILSQLPLGILSDHFGRKRILTFVTIAGFLTFTAAGVLQQSVIGLFTCLFLAGMLVGSTYSLGIAYMVDLLPKQLLPSGNILCGILFSLGSVSGPFIGGLTIQYLEGISFFYTISLILLIISIALISFKPKSNWQLTTKPHEEKIGY